MPASGPAALLRRAGALLPPARRGRPRKGAVSSLVPDDEEFESGLFDWEFLEVGELWTTGMAKPERVVVPQDSEVYASLCTTAEYHASAFGRLLAAEKAQRPRGATVTHAEARASLEEWLGAVYVGGSSAAAGQKVHVTPACRARVLENFDAHAHPTIYLYTEHIQIARRTTIRKEEDYSRFYLAVNNHLNHDTAPSLQALMPLLRRMMHVLRYTDDGERWQHPGGVYYRGDSARPRRAYTEKLAAALQDGTVIRFRQFLSTSDSRSVARGFARSEDFADVGGFLWTIHIPEGFVGCRAIQDMSAMQEEEETLFPPYSAFVVEALSASGCTLRAVDSRHDSPKEGLGLACTSAQQAMPESGPMPGIRPLMRVPEPRPRPAGNPRSPRLGPRAGPRSPRGGPRSPRLRAGSPGVAAPPAAPPPSYYY